jgi:5-formyltetrahydrofolate cyclo-ligase
MTKSALRQHFLAQRRSLSAEDIESRSVQISNKLFHLFLTNTTPGNLHLFLPIVRQNEVNTWHIVHRIWQDFPAIRIAVSVSNTITNQLSHYVLTPETSLIVNGWGVPEPRPEDGCAIAIDQLDIVLVPLLAFDLHGHRVGYGKGYYDRFLVQCRPDCQKIGLSLFNPIDLIADTEPTDIRLNACITPEQTYWFTRELSF